VNGRHLAAAHPAFFVSATDLGGYAVSNAIPDLPAGAEAEVQNPGLPSVVLQIRARLGPNASPEQVAAEVRASGFPNTSDEDVRQLWDEGHLPGG
jgi:hypothetical protein